MADSKTILILGGGVGGVATARALRKRLPSTHRVMLVDRERDHVFAPSLLWLMVGQRTADAITRPLARLARKDIEVRLGKVERIDPDLRIVTVAGEAIAADYLVIALGAELAPEAIPGLAAAGHNFYTRSGAESLWGELQNLPDGRIVVLTAAPAYKCPAAPYEGAMLIDAWCRKHGRRDRVHIEVYAAEPAPMGVAGPHVSAAVTQLLAAKGIPYHPEHQVTTVDAERKRVTFGNGAQVDFDVLAYVPPHRAPAVIRDSGLTSDSGWMAVDRHTLQTRWNNVYAIGDVVSIPLALGKPLPKAGSSRTGRPRSSPRISPMPLPGRRSPRGSTDMAHVSSKSAAGRLASAVATSTQSRSPPCCCASQAGAGTSARYGSRSPGSTTRCERGGGEMTKQIEADTLREWLDAHRPVTVLDIRADQDRAQWAIPGSMHLNAYDALRSGQPGRLADAAFPPDRPIVTVCNAGRVSQTAAEFLAERGFDVRSLTGGMKAWSLAWNTARVPINDDGATIIQVRRTGKGCLSYVLISDGDAAVIDASLPLEVYENIARSYSARIRRVIETHIHADHLSRARQLADRVGAQLLLPHQERVAFPFTAVQDGDEIAVGSARLIARHTPGHTLESMSYVLKDNAVFTGDTLFTKGVGRPDLHADAAGARDRARALFQSLQAIRTLGSDVIVLPAHASEPIAFDGRPVMSRMSSIDKWLGDWLGSEASFVDRVVSRLPETPPNFGRIVELNERGEMPDGDVTELEAGANRCAVS